jgi:PAS domain S-box-containing protein
MKSWRSQAPERAVDPSGHLEDLEAFVAALPDYAIFLLDSDGRIRSWNAGAERIKGYQASEIIGRHLSEFYTAEDQAAGRPQQLLDIAASRGVVRDEGWRVRKDSTRFWAEVTLTALRNPDGTVRGFAKVTRDQTSKRLVEEGLRQSEEKFRLLLEGVKDYAIFMLDPMGRVASWNRGAELIKGYTADEIVGQHFGRFYPADDLARGKPDWELLQAVEQGQYEEEGWRLRKDGTRFWASVLITAVRNDRGELRGFAKVTRDLSERKRAREQLIQEQMSRARAEAVARRTGMLAELSQALMRPLDAADTLTRVAQVMTHHLADYCIVDLRAADGTLRRLATAHSNAEKEPLVAELRRSYPAERQPNYPTLVVFRTGAANLVREITEEMLVVAATSEDHLKLLRALNPCSHMIVPVRANDQIIGTLSLVSTRRDRLYDASDMVLAEDVAARAGLAIANAELFESERRARSAAEMLARAGAVLSASLDYAETLQSLANVVCPALADWCIIAMRQPDGRLANAAVAHADPAKVKWAFDLAERYPIDQDAPSGAAHVATTGEVEVYSSITDDMLVHAAKDEEHLRILRELGIRAGICVPVAASGRVLGALTLISAESKRVYDDWDVELAKELARRAAMAADNARLYEESRAAVRIRDDFIGIASHELRTPLSALRLHIQSMLRTATKESADERQITKLQSAMQQIDRQTRMINQLLDFSRLVAGRVELTLEEIDLAVLLQEVAQRFMDEAHRNKVQLVVATPPTLMGHWDLNVLDQIFTNLVSNAVKYGREHPVEITLAREGASAKVVVRDHGIGIAPADQERIFDRFERAVSSRNYGGFGLGLWITRRGVENLGGTITVKSAPGQGATFTIELPIEGKPKP